MWLLRFRTVDTNAKCLLCFVIGVDRNPSMKRYIFIHAVVGLTRLLDAPIINWKGRS